MSGAPLTSSAATGGRRVALLAVVGIMTAAGPLGTDMYLPAMPQVAADLHAPDGLAQLTLTAYLVGLGVGQFVWGPISDRTGRRTPLLIGLALFTLAGLLCAVTPSIWLLLVGRAVEGLAGSAAVVIGRAIVRDLYEGDALTRIFGRLAVVFGIAPVVGPVIGAGLLTFTNWRGTFIGLAVLGAVLATAVVLLVPETLEPARRIHGRSEERRAAWVAPLKDGEFLVYTVVLVGATVAMLSYITMVSFVMQVERGIPETVFALLFGMSALMVIAGGQLGPMLSRRLGGGRVLIAAQALNVVFAVFTAVASGQHWPTPVLYVSLILSVLMASISQPLSLALAIAPFGRGAGTASAIAGGSQMALGAVIPGIVTNVFGWSGVTLGTAQAVASGVTAILAACGLITIARRARARASAR